MALWGLHKLWVVSVRTELLDTQLVSSKSDHLFSMWENPIYLVNKVQRDCSTILEEGKNEANIDVFLSVLVPNWEAEQKYVRI